MPTSLQSIENHSAVTSMALVGASKGVIHVRDAVKKGLKKQDQKSGKGPSTKSMFTMLLCSAGTGLPYNCEESRKGRSWALKSSWSFSILHPIVGQSAQGRD